MILVGPAYVIKDHYVAICRDQHRMPHASKIIGIVDPRGGDGNDPGWSLVGPHGDLRRVGRSPPRSWPCSWLPAVLHVYRRPPPSIPALAVRSNPK